MYKGKQNPQYKHGETNTRLHKIWCHMRERCNNPHCKRYKDYGGRGISVYTGWNEYVNFRNWALENGYKDDLTIDRIDNNGNYEPSNCRWITNKEQCNNRRTNRIIEIDGLKMNEKEWSEFLGVPCYVLRTRLHRGMSEREAITTPIRTKIEGKYYFIDYYKQAKQRLEDETAQMNFFDMGWMK